ncbi:MAG: glycosyltransferase family 4 protein, partial [Planctomycetaceae bacterium]|nr:glycosyltransferase family 4 protein [Planctomycetaceae bacterium]
MKHLLLCPEFPPAPAGGIGVYAAEMSRLLASRGETVHVIGQLWEKADPSIERTCDGRLVIHRIPHEDGASLLPPRPHPALDDDIAAALFRSPFPPQCFAWQAALLAERLIEEEGIDIIEAQEYQAPLYYFQLRRALGLGPRQRPPCLVHLHSPTEYIARHNDWDFRLPHVTPAIELENFSILAADALVCPSQFLARQIEAQHGLAAGAVQTIPYPMGEWVEPPLDPHRGTRPSVCFVGRVEPRKGVYEWTDAAARVAGEFPEATFDFIGGDTLDRERSVRSLVANRIPRAVRSHFRFHGEQRRQVLSRFLAEARLSVVPSRWDNFPFTCMEAMATGIPVLATRQGGMAEMIEDGETGWLAETANPDALANALQRALSTPAKESADMGRRAAISIRQLCDNDRIVDAHLELRRQLVNAGVRSEVPVPSSLPAGSA